MKIRAPGKLILSGEHAVVYGKPALAMAINRYVTTTISPHHLQQVIFDFADLDYHAQWSFSELLQAKTKITQRYAYFLQQIIPVKDVLKNPVDLLLFAASLVFFTVPDIFKQGCKINLHSTIPMGCGMGSSAAAVLSLGYALQRGLALPFSQDTLYQMSLQAESAQHGFSSGLDLYMSLHGGCVRMEKGIAHVRPLPSSQFFLVNTGIPASSTGECVSAVAHYFKGSSIGDRFAAVTQQMDTALQQRDSQSFAAAIQANHQLLVAIGVVPARVQSFIEDIEKRGGSAKVCGAGAVAGEQAGVLLVMIDDIQALQAVCIHYGYTILPIAAEAHGVHVVKSRSRTTQ